MTSTAAGLAFYNHIIPLVSKFVKTSKTHVTLSRTVSSGQDITEKRKFSVPLLNNHDVETICRCILEFCDVCHTTRLSLTQGPLKFTYFRQCLDGITRDDWDLITANSNPTNDGFHQATTELLLQNIKPTDLADQEHYIRHCKKPFKYNCHELSSRLQFMNKMMSLFPGAHDTPPFTHQDLKNIYFKMMPIEWQHAFINNGQDIASNHYTLLNLQQYMGTQETLRRTLTQARRLQNNQSCIQSPNENTPNQRRRIEENNNGPYRQRFQPQNPHNGNTRNFQHHPYYRNTANNNNQTTSNNQGQHPERNRRAGQTHLPPSVPPPKHPASQCPNDMYYADNNNHHPYEDENEFDQDHYEPNDSIHYQNHEDTNQRSFADQPDITNSEQNDNNTEYDDYDNLSSAES